MMDSNKDGVLTSDDQPAPPQDGDEGPRRGSRFTSLLERADTDGNQQVTFDEAKAVFTELTQERFDKMDSNKDGVVTSEDRPTRPERRMPRDEQSGTEPAAPPAQ